MSAKQLGSFKGNEFFCLLLQHFCGFDVRKVTERVMSVQLKRIPSNYSN